MKDQYFGDINDYRKYGLLRALAEASGLPLGVCWLLTAGDKRNDGEFRRYLEEPERWEHHDPELYRRLRRLCEPGVERSVGHAEAWDLVSGARYFPELLEDGLEPRTAYFTRAWEALAGCPLLFFDPDNGLEVPSKRRGYKQSAKYVYWCELEEAWGRGHSLVIYQHWTREKRPEYTRRLVGECFRRLRAPLVDSFATAHVLFLLVGQAAHMEGLRRAHDLVLSRWAGQITPMRHAGVAWDPRQEAAIQPEEIPNLTLLRGFEGGTVSVGSLPGRYFVVTSESAVADLLGSDELGETSSVREFPTKAGLRGYLRERGWA